MNHRVLTLGEAAVVLDPIDAGGFELGSRFQLRVSGSEANFGIALARLGVEVTWASRLGAGALGDLVVRVLAAERIDMRYVTRVEAAPTAVTFKIRHAGSTSLVYYRRGSAASGMEMTDVPDAAIERAGLVHLSGITMALGDGPRDLVTSVMRRARQRAVTTTFDVNYRGALWSHDQAALACRAVLPDADWVFCGEDEARLLFGGRDRESVIERLQAAGANGIVLRIGGEGALVVVDRGITHVKTDALASIVDDIGAGDAFDAGFVYGLVNGLSPDRSASIGNALAVHALSGTGDCETMPTVEELRSSLPAGILPVDP